jgi:ribA/ribD-fused uncharacterized protein
LKENYHYAVCPRCGVLRGTPHYPHCYYDPKMPMPLDSNAPITEFRQEYRFLSNFWPCTVRYGMYSFPSVEHAYQAAKTLDVKHQNSIRLTESAAMAKRMGKVGTLRPDWNEIRLEVMADLLWQKFVLNPGLRKRLLETGDRELIEGNKWNDTYWGQCDGKGKNHLGRLLMLIRGLARYLAANQYEPEPAHQKLYLHCARQLDGSPDRATAG